MFTQDELFAQSIRTAAQDLPTARLASPTPRSHFLTLGNKTNVGNT